AGSRSRARRAHVRVRDPAPGGHADPAGSGGVPHRAGDRPAQAARAAGGRRELPAVSDWQGLQEGSGGHGGERGGPMRRVDLHACPGTAEWIASQGPYVEPLGRYWKREWTARTEEEVVADFRAHGIEAVLVAFDIESVTGAPPCTSAYVAGMRDRHPEAFAGAWGTVDPLRGEQAIGEARRGGAAARGARFCLPPAHGRVPGD